MPGSADRIRVDIRMTGSDLERVEKILADLGPVKGADGHDFAIVTGPSQDPAGNDRLVVVGPDDEAEMLAAVEEGAMGYLVGTSSATDLEAALGSVANGQAVIPPMMLGALLRHTVRRRQTTARVEERLEVLTRRERQVIEHLSRGRQRREIARNLRISPETVRTHIQRAMAKLGVHSQNELMALLAPLDRGGT